MRAVGLARRIDANGAAIEYKHHQRGASSTGGSAGGVTGGGGGARANGSGAVAGAAATASNASTGSGSGSGAAAAAATPKSNASTASTASTRSAATANGSNASLTSSTSASDISANEVGPVRYQAPEVLRAHQHSTFSDVWSFGVVMWEIFARDIPYKNASLVDIANGVLENGSTLAIDASWPEVVKEVLAGCWKLNPNERLTMEQILVMLQQAMSAIPDDDGITIGSPLTSPGRDEPAASGAGTAAGGAGGSSGGAGSGRGGVQYASTAPTSGRGGVQYAPVAALEEEGDGDGDESGEGEAVDGVAAGVVYDNTGNA